jgi:hypothetical protein
LISYEENWKMMLPLAVFQTRNDQAARDPDLGPRKLRGLQAGLPKDLIRQLLLAPQQRVAFLEHLRSTPFSTVGFDL